VTPPGDPWNEVSAARLPAAALGALAPVRDRPDVRVRLAGDAAWVDWPAGRADVLVCLRPVVGVEFFLRRGDPWHRFGSRVPSADDPPPGDARPLADVLHPARFTPVPPPTELPAKAPLRLVRGGGPHPVTGMACSLAALARWADAATTLELAAVRAARDGDRVFALGDCLPPLPGAVRFWGDGVYLPVGFRVEPAVSADAVRGAVGAAKGEAVFLAADAVDVVPVAALAPLTRAGVRLALRPAGVP
jgi:hypothetical protein